MGCGSAAAVINNNIKAGRREYRTVSDYCMASKIVARPFKTQRSTVGALILGPARSDLSSNRERSRGEKMARAMVPWALLRAPSDL